MRASIIILVIIALSVPALLHARHIGTIGNVYEITEKDAVQELKERAAQIDWKKIEQGAWKRAREKNFRPFNYTSSLAKAPKNRKRVVDVTYELEWDVHDVNGKIAYPKGHKINPADFARLDHVPVLIDGTDPAQIEWFKNKWGQRSDAVLLITEGDPIGLIDKVKRKVFWTSDLMIKRFKLQYVTCEIHQMGNVIQVEEFYVSDQTNRKKN